MNRYISNPNYYLCPQSPSWDKDIESRIGRELTEAERWEKIKHCSEGEHVSTSPFEWVSKGALVGWFGPISNIAIVLTFISILGAMFYFIFRSDFEKKIDEKHKT